MITVITSLPSMSKYNWILSCIEKKNADFFLFFLTLPETLFFSVAATTYLSGQKIHYFLEYYFDLFIIFTIPLIGGYFLLKWIF